MRSLTIFALFMWLLVVSRSSDYWLCRSPHATLTSLVDVEVCLGIPLCISVHDTHVVNTVGPVVPEVPDQKVSLLFRGLWWRGPRCGAVTGSGGLGCCPCYGATLVNEGVVAYVRGGESPARQIRDPVTELIVTHRDKATPRAVEGVENGKLGVAAVTVFREVWGLKAIAQEGGITPFLRSPCSDRLDRKSRSLHGGACSGLAM